MRTASGKRTDCAGGGRQLARNKPLIAALLASLLAHLALLAGGNPLFLPTRSAPPLAGRLQPASHPAPPPAPLLADSPQPPVPTVLPDRPDQTGGLRGGKPSRPVKVPAPAEESPPGAPANEEALRDYRIAIARALGGSGQTEWKAAPARVELVVRLAPGLPAQVSVARSSGNRAADREAERRVRLAIAVARPPDALSGSRVVLPLVVELGEASAW